MKLIEKILSDLGIDSCFCAESGVPPGSISAEVEKVGAFGFPISQSQSKKLIEVTEAAPFAALFLLESVQQIDKPTSSREVFESQFKNSPAYPFHSP